MYMYNNKEVEKIYRGGFLVYNHFDNLVTKLFTNNEQGFVYDPNDLTSEKINWRRNMLTETEFRNGINDSSVKAGSLTSVSFAGLTAGTGVQVGSATGGTYIYKTTTYKANTPYTFSCYVRMLDGSTPRLGTNASGADVDICLVARGQAVQAIVENLGGGLFRAYATVSGTVISGSFGVVKYQGNSTKPVIISGYQLEEGTLTAYQPITDFNTEFLKEFPTHALYQDVIGTVPITSSSQPIGLMLDKSNGLVLGGELSNTTAPFTIFRDATTVTSAENIGLVVAGKAYLVEFTISATRGTMNAGFRIANQPSNLVASPTFGSKGGVIHAILFPRISGNLQMVALAAGTDFTVSSYSLKELAGNHAYQTVSASRPLLKQTPILGNELANNDGWISSYIDNIPTKLPDGRYKIERTSTQSARLIQPVALIEGRLYSASVEIETLSVAVKIQTFLSNYSSVGAVVLGTVPANTRTTVNAYFTAPTGAVNIGGLMNIEQVGDGYILGKITVREVTGYRTDQNYLQFDGVDDFLVTNSIDFTNTDKISLFTGVRKLSDGSYGVIAEHGTNTDVDGSFVVTTASDYGYYLQNGAIGNSTLLVASGGDVAPRSDLITVNIDRIKTDITELGYSVNSNTLSSDLVQIEGSGANGVFGNFPLYLGRRSGNTLPFNGYIYSLIGIGRLTTDIETTALENSIAKKVGVLL